jgi:hypothetical protein
MEKVYVTKFALTKGIFSVEAKIVGKRAVVQGRLPWDRVSFAEGDWHRTEEAAIIAARKLAENKAGQLEREAGRLRAMEFAVQHPLDNPGG